MLKLIKKVYTVGEVESYGNAEYEFDIPSETTCLQLILEDGYGDGWTQWGEDDDGNVTPVPGIQLYNEWDILIKDKQNVEYATNFGIDLDVLNIFVSVDELSSNANIDNSKIKIYPTLANNIINIDGIEDINSITVFDIAGNKVNNGIDLTNNQLMIENLLPGMYIIKFDSKYQTQLQRFVKK